MPMLLSQKELAPLCTDPRHMEGDFKAIKEAVLELHHNRPGYDATFRFPPEEGESSDRFWMFNSLMRYATGSAESV